MNDRALLATRKGLFELTRSNGRWHIAPAGFVGEPLSMVLHDRRDGTQYAALNLGHFGVKLHRRDSDAQQWTEIAVPAYPPQPEPRGTDVEWKLSMIWSLVAGGTDEPGVLWAGTLPGGLFRSRDRGDSWELMRALWDVPGRSEWFGGGYDTPGIHSICVDPRDSRHVLVGISCGGAWTTRDGGASWTVTASGMRAAYMPPEREEEPGIQDPHRIVQCPSAPDVLWCQHHNGIWRSTDAAASWQEIGQQVKPLMSDFGFAVAAHPHDAQTAWFAPAAADQQRIPVDAALCVTRTRDGGQSFDVLRKGLPQQDCYDLVYRHGLAVADDGNTLLMGSTTGGLWASDDGGDNWQTVAMTLPPIYALRFV
ncbi:exo-alpha-sialidase [Noviherbaspirillum cavernae]|uniref:Exo-alpha-sialidase n=1 Tax=Noviherbaspirillum cavernae TaxID=2320862 RepID=A0A418WWP0_9BURK|nr:exo-alpha-sialidase [Noviherbaspirillum cavernae]RJF97063.1 exo-alpha-sialidase [Noviherbaspirillum cavernae]